MPARNAIANASRASCSIDNNRLVMLGTAGPECGAAPAPSRRVYGFAELCCRGGGDGGRRTFRGRGPRRRFGSSRSGGGLGRFAAQLASLLLGQAVVLLPLFRQPLLLVRRQLLHLLVALARGLSLLGRELCPRLHPTLYPRLLVRLHLRVAIRDADPFALPLGLELVPVCGKRREDLLLLRLQLSPAWGLFGCGSEDGRVRCKAKVLVRGAL